MKIDLMPTILDRDSFSQFLKAIELWHQAISLLKLEIKPTVNLDEWNYKVTTMDGRVWDQTLRLNSGVFTMNFNVVPYFKVAEFAPGRDVRDLAQRLILAGVTNIKIDF